jgi:hypothetical protein
MDHPLGWFTHPAQTGHGVAGATPLAKMGGLATPVRPATTLIFIFLYSFIFLMILVF